VRTYLDPESIELALKSKDWPSLRDVRSSNNESGRNHDWRNDQEEKINFG